MPKIHLETIINIADIDIVFNLIRSIDLHKISTKNSKEEAIAGKTSGLISLNETVTWRAKHLGFTQELTSIITDFEAPTFFADEMVHGAFKSFRHEHFLERKGDKVIVKDIFDFTSPFGVLGKIADFIFLKKYMQQFLIERNKVIKYYAESGKWREVLEKELL
ncbi:cell division protein [Polaribacter sejongensis]|uniref:Cell division protein n=1 Tax=Polaribacter sejongensis TaxID=985043 RepID=A0ABM6Q3G0_9FLAO|nr:SRPBCC family protein [Polaribacter sejongensis]AUC23676.1 cell division protein [Polaribacter sejongensis]